jgi:hypothetical protein
MLAVTMSLDYEYAYTFYSTGWIRLSVCSNIRRCKWLRLLEFLSATRRHKSYCSPKSMTLREKYWPSIALQLSW